MYMVLLCEQTKMSQLDTFHMVWRHSDPHRMCQERTQYTNQLGLFHQQTLLQMRMLYME